MRKKGTILVVALFLTAAVVLVLLDRDATKPAVPADAKDLSVEQTADVAQDVTALSYSDGSITLRFTRGEDGSWKWADETKFPLDGTYPDHVVATAKSLPVLATIPLTEEAPLSTYGLDNATVYLSYTTANGEVKLTLGNQDGDGNYYVSRSDDEANVYLTDNALRQELSIPIERMMALPALPAMTEANIRSVSIIGSSGNAVTFDVAAQEKGTVWTVDGAEVTDRAEVTAFEAELAAYSMDACLDYAPSDTAYALCGLGSPTTVLTVTYVNTVNVETTFTMTIGNQRGENYCAVMSNDATIYLINGSKVATLLSLAANGLTA
jgi:hypothetical protein